MRRPREDGPDTWHHVLNRGIAKRTIFETERDHRVFLALLAKEVRAGRLEVHAYCLMLTHFHMLVRSPRGELSEAMRRIQNGYARYFNRTRKRDGPLFRGRFRSRRIHSLRYRRNVLAYIHDNAVSAGLVANRSEYGWSSAYHWKDGETPPWLERTWVLEEIERRGGSGSWDERMEETFPDSLDEEHRAWVERQLRDRAVPENEPEEASLKHSASPRVVAWAVRKAKLADGTRPWRPVCPAQLVEEVLQGARYARRTLQRLFPRRLARGLALLRGGLLRMLAGCTHREIALRTGRHRGTVSHDIKDHRELAEANPAYEKLAARLTRTALAAIGV